MKHQKKSRKEKSGQSNRTGEASTTTEASKEAGQSTEAKIVDIPPKPEGKEGCNCRLEWVCDEAA